MKRSIMDEKVDPEDVTPTSTHSEQLRHARVQRRRAGPRLAAFLIAAVTTYFMLALIASYIPRCSLSSFLPYQEHDMLPVNKQSRSKVALEAHIMSKCPDAKDCLKDLIVPAMEQVSDKVDFALSYIGKVTEDHGDEDVECMHGPEECLGNIIQLCAANLYPDPKTYLGFSMCMINDYSLIPQKDLIKDCALEHGLSFDELNDCASKDDGAFGLDLLRNSVTRTANANVTKSCTVRLNDDVRCIRDGGEWKECPDGHDVDDLIEDIRRKVDHR